MPITTWIRDLLGIPKDVIDLKKSKLELERLEEEKQERHLVSRATLDDVKKYDPKYQELLDAMEAEEASEDFAEIQPRAGRQRRAIIWIWLVLLIILVVIVYRACVV